MKERIVEFKLADGSTVYIQSGAIEEGGETDRRLARTGGSGRKVVEEAKQGFEEAIRVIRPATEALMSTLREINHPDEVELEFGINFSGQLGVVLASVDSEASLKVKIKWTNPKEKA